VTPHPPAERLEISETGASYQHLGDFMIVSEVLTPRLPGLLSLTVLSDRERHRLSEPRDVDAREER
jgi:hypothetical protein